MSNSANLLKGKKVLVIGGSSGIGRSVAAAALSNGASVVISSSSAKKVDAAVEKLKQGSQNVADVTVKGRAVDLKDQDALKAFLSEEAPFDHLAITAGGLPERLQFPEVGVTDAFKSEFDVRYWAIVAASQHIANNKLINPGGSVTFTIGTTYYRPLPGFGLLSGIMGAVEASTRGFAVDLKPIRAPGMVDTEILDTIPLELKNKMLEKSSKEFPVGHVGTPDELAEAYIFAMKVGCTPGKILHTNS
ncbi:hypothetical protein BN14_07851 [Rhizoctonia solani AG-1 IB]|uniref:Uncharacterized protein n=1 Tax=Thanatephorus cucumeris (strain AG1-IB / isolate 7/3/14) TaxID=1108050 RepID=M5C3Y6_THACB|nr:hypothetical protein BN14_07851 [Rhizoctonia solani AG-1 IB]